MNKFGDNAQTGQPDQQRLARLQSKQESELALQNLDNEN